MYCILIPTINQNELLTEALHVYAKVCPNVSIFIHDNGKQNIPITHDRVKVFTSDTNLGVAASWNSLIREAAKRGYENFLILNDDIILIKTQEEINQLLAKGNDNTFHRPRPLYNWSAFLLRGSIIRKVGNFDEAFQRCYFEDNDYEYRMRLNGITIKYEDDLNPEVYKNSQSILKEPLLNNYIDNREYYIKKWGGAPSEEKYKTPFNL